MRLSPAAFAVFLAAPALAAAALVATSCSSTKPASSAATDAGSPVEAEAAAPVDPSQAMRASCSYDVGSLAADTQGPSAPVGASIPIDTIVVIMMENRSFDHYFEDLPNQGWTDVDVAPVAAGDAGPDAAQTTNPGVDGTPVPFVHGTQLCFADTNHSWDGTHQEIDNGKMDGFAVANDGTHEDPMVGPPGFLSGARAMTYYTKDDLPFMYWAAANFAIGDRYFASVPGPTWPNREYFYAGTSWGETTTGDFPTPTSPTVLDSLTTAGVSWGYYTPGTVPTTLIFVNSPTYASYTSNVFPFDQFTSAAAAGTLPHVVILDPSLFPEGYDNNDEHPPAVMQVGEAWRAGVVQSLIASPQWAHMALFLLYDEHGGLYDHVPPPPACPPDSTPPMIAVADGGAYGGFDEYGVRLPFVAMSPYAKSHYVSHQVFDHTSVLRFIEARFGLPALTKRDANALAPWDVFDFNAPPNLTPPAMPDVPVDPDVIDQCAMIFTSAIPVEYSQ
jgi:phospholipase C